MGLTLAELRQAMSAYTAAFDAAVVPPGRLGELLSDAGAIERMASTLSCLVAARLAGGAVRGTSPAWQAEPARPGPRRRPWPARQARRWARPAGP